MYPTSHTPEELVTSLLVRTQCPSTLLGPQLVPYSCPTSHVAQGLVCHALGVGQPLHGEKGGFARAQPGVLDALALTDPVS